VCNTGITAGHRLGAGDPQELALQRQGHGLGEGAADGGGDGAGCV